MNLQLRWAALMPRFGHFYGQKIDYMHMHNNPIHARIGDAAWRLAMVELKFHDRGDASILARDRLR